jgi:hypothetical protein
MYDKKTIFSFAENIGKSTTEQYNDTKSGFADKPVPSYEYYEQAAEEDVPSYRMEPAKSGRSACKQKGTACKHTDPIIQKDEIRIGRLDKEAGTYTNWHHLTCWRVPSKVWLAFSDCLEEGNIRSALTEMNEVLMSGFSELNESDKILVINYCLDKNNWAKKVNKSSKAKVDANNETAPPQSTKESEAKKSGASFASVTESLSLTKSSTAMTFQSGGQFQLRPGFNGAKPDALLGKTIGMFFDAATLTYFTITTFNYYNYNYYSTNRSLP